MTSDLTLEGLRESGLGFRNVFVFFLFVDVKSTQPFNRPSGALIRKAIHCLDVIIIIIISLEDNKDVNNLQGTAIHPLL